MNISIRLTKALFAFACCLALTAAPIFAQQITATVTGTITDQNGAVVPGATVTAVSLETGLSKSAQSNDQGRFTITFLQPANYNLTIEKSGFANTVRENIKLEVAQTATIDFALSVTAGQVDVTIENSETPLLITENSGLETTVENKLIEDLPSGERSTLSFVNLVPGAIDAGFAQARGEGLNENGNAQGPIGSPGNRNFFDSNFAVNGGRSSTNDILLDGVSNTVGDFNGVAVSPPQDSVREFKVQSGAFSAEFGRTGGGVVNLVTRAGGKDFHGALYEYFQDGDLNANGWQRNRRGNLASGTAVLPRIDIRRHQFGGTIGGPILLPRFGEGGKIFNKLERTFFFFNYEGRREKNPFSREITLPTARMRTGDLGELLGGQRGTLVNADGTPALFGQIYNPFTNLVGGNRPYIAGNRLDSLPRCPASGARTVGQACLDPVALRLLQFLPAPNVPGLINNYVYNDTVTFNRDIVAGRVDHTFSEKHSFFARYSRERRFQAEPNFLGSAASNVRKVKDTFVNLTFNDVYSFTPNIINNFRYGYTRVRAKQLPESLGFDPTELGLPSYLRDRASVLKFPDFTIGGGAQGQTLAGEITGGIIGGAGNNQPRDTHTIANGVTWITGNHTVRGGGEFRLYRFYPFQYFTPTGSFSFSRTWTRGPNPTANPANVAETGSSLASFLLGLPSGGSFETVTPVTVFHHYGAAYLQDDWKIRRNLTLNLGLRWDYETPTEETHGLITNFDVNAPAPVQVPQGAAIDGVTAQLNPGIRNLRGLLAFVNGAQSKTNYDRFAPRVGFALSINDKTTLRGGYGLYYVPISLEGTTTQGTNFTQNLPQSSQTAQVNINQAGQPTTFLTDPFPGNIITAAPGTSLGARTRLGQEVFVVEPERPNALNHSWNLVVQRQLAKNLVLDVGYVGGRGRNLPIQTANVNQLTPDVINYARNNFAAGNNCGATVTSTTLDRPCTSTANFLNQNVPNPIFGQVPGQTAAVSRITLLRPFPQYTNVTLFRPHLGKSDYHALQINLQKRFSDGLSATANYTWSKLLDTGGVGNGAAFLDSTAIQNVYDLDAEYSLSTLDVPHRFVASWTYELPFGNGKRFGKNWNGFVNALLGGWQTSGIYTWQRGTPIQIIASAFSAGVGTPAAGYRPNRAAGVENFSVGDARDNTRSGGTWFNPALFIDPPDFEFGNAARTYNDVRRDNYKNINLSILKNFNWADNKQKLQLRAEFLNAFNWVVFGTPGLNINVPANSTQTGFGQVRTQGNTPRSIQLVARYTF